MTTTNTTTKRKEVTISSFDASAFGGMMLAKLEHPIFSKDWNRKMTRENKKALCSMFIELNKKLPFPFKNEEVRYVEELLITL